MDQGHRSHAGITGQLGIFGLVVDNSYIYGMYHKAN